MLEKMFTTKMSMDKKKLQNRFSKIRSKNGKTSKFIAMAVFAVIIVSIICVSIWVAVNRQDDTTVNSDIKLTFNGEIISFQNDPYIFSETLPTGFSTQTMAFFPLEELCQKLGAECEKNFNEAVIKIPGANDNYRISLGKNEIYYESLIGASATRETKTAPEAKNSTLYIPYEFIEYIFIDANNYDIFGSTLYKNETMNIQFEIPMYWLGKYIADETLEDDGYVVLKHSAIAKKYEGEVTIDFYGRLIPKHAHGTVNIRRYTASTRILTNAIIALYDSIVNPNLLIRRVNIAATRLRADTTKDQIKYQQLDLFSSPEELDQMLLKKDKQIEKERRSQKAILELKKRFGKNAVMKGMNYQDKATMKDRNEQIGGHKA